MTVTLDSLKKTIGKKKMSMAFAWLADYERAAGDLNKALQRLNSGIGTGGDDLPGMLVRSSIYFQQNDFEACIKECKAVLVKDPFCLAALKRLGDSYDQLGNEGLRNNYYRRVHDMDPLDTFWKDEYNASIDDPDDVMTAAAAAATGAVSESDFVMSDLMGETSGGEEGVLEFTEGSEPQAEDSFSFEKSAEDSVAVAEEPAAEEDSLGSIFSKSAETISLDEPEPTLESPFSSASESFDAEPAPVEVAEEPVEEETSADEDPFAALSALLPDVDAGEEAAMENLADSLESAMSDIGDTPSAQEFFPSDDEIEGDDVHSALAGMFGIEDDLEADVPEEEPVAFAAPAAEAPKADEPVSVDTAFSSIFGDDELPEEKPVETAPKAEEPVSVDDAFSSIFGEDELPEELPTETAAPVEAAEEIEEPAAEEAVAEESLELPSEESAEGFGFEKSAEEESFGFEKSAEEESFGFEKSAEEESFGFEKSAEESLELPSEEPAAEEPAAEESAIQFSMPSDILKDEDESLVEPEQQDQAPADDFVVQSSFDSVLTENGVSTEVSDAPMESIDVEDPLKDLFGDLGDDLPEESPVNETPITVEAEAMFKASANETAEDFLDIQSTAAATADMMGGEAAAAVDSLFGDLSDDLPEERPAESLAEQVVQAEDALELPATQEKNPGEEFEQEMGGAFEKMFGEDDDELDLPAAQASAPATTEDTGAAIEEAAAPTLESDLDSSFSNLFGGDDDLPVEGESAPAEVAAPAAEMPAEVPVAESSVRDEIESEVSGAFQGLFDTEDDLPEENDQPSNKGVDFLMSGDSDDEVSVGLIQDPSAPLQTAGELDESLNTRTLAEIYFEQGLYGKALEIYQDLARKEPSNAEIASRLSEVERLYREKFGG